MHRTPSDSTPFDLSDLLGQISSALRALDGEPPDATAQALLSGYAAQVSSMADAKRSPNRLPRAIRSQLAFLALGLQIVAREVPSHNQGDPTADLREVRQMLAACRRDADKLNLP